MKLSFRRRREHRTNYRLRKKLILSGLPLFYVFRSLRYITVSFIIPKPEGDHTVAAACSKELMKRFGLVSGKNLPAAYLTGLLAGARAKKAGISKAIINLGVTWSKKASIPFAAAQGARDAGIEIPIGEEALVDWKRIRGEHIANYAKLLKQTDIERYKRMFSQYLEKGLDPESLPEKFDQIREVLLKEASSNG